VQNREIKKESLEDSLFRQSITIILFQKTMGEKIFLLEVYHHNSLKPLWRQGRIFILYLAFFTSNSS